MTVRRGAVLAAGVVALLALHAVLVWPVHGFLLSDTTGYLADARWLAGRADATWQGPTSFYHPGWSVLVAPLYRVMAAPRDIQLGALVLNAVLATAILPAGYALARWAFGLPVRLALAGAAVAATYPAVLLLSGYEWGEALYQLVFVLFVLAAAAVVARPGFLPAVALGFTAAALNATHPRGLGVVAVAGVFLVVVGWQRRLPRPAAGTGLAVLVVLFVATRLVDHALLDAIYSTRSAAIEGDVLGRLTDPHLLWGAVKATVGQLWYLSVATLGLAPLGALWLLTTRRLPTPLRVVTLAACLATLAASALEMSDGTRVDHMVYGRYVEGMVPVLLVAGAAAVAAWRHVLPRLLAGVVVLTAGLAGLLLLLRGRDVFHGNVMPLNVTGILFWRRSESEVEVLRITVLALLATGAVLAVARWKALAGLALVAALFAGSAASAQARTLRPFDDYWGNVTEIPEAVRAVSDHGAVSYDKAGYDAYAANFYQLELSDRGVRFFDSRTGPEPTTDLVIAAPDWHEAGARLVLVEAQEYRDQALWVLPGALLDRLARDGYLLPDDPTAALPDPVQRIDAGVPGHLAPGARRTIDVDVAHLGGGAAWRPLGVLAPDQGAVRLGARWVDAAGTEVASQTAELHRVLLPGDSTTTELPLVAPTQPGRYRLTIGLRQEGLDWFAAPRTFTVEVR
ncbi:MAG: hypothetical protein JWO68_2981 [Actinomycetia bacterium]|nr:hypothetical protein [Actinomycetes bacterium]